MNIFYSLIGEKIRPVELAVLIKKALFIKRRTIKIREHLFCIDPISNFGLSLQKNNNYEPEMTAVLKKILIDGDIFIDLGANEGWFSVLASKAVGTSGKVFSIEPQSRLWPVILKNLSINGSFNCQLLPYAVGEKEEEIKITLAPTINTGSSSLISTFRSKFWPKQVISVKRLDDLLSTITQSGKNKVKLIKIDIEGFEYFALKSLGNLLQQGIIENILIEIHGTMLRQLNLSSESVIDLLIQNGYEKSSAYNDVYLFTFKKI
ncbi:FkbM family methyltransferase [Niastella sp. OAS944]|uniref:FkbM family methyltransferase n=1 Tax=Niastella sp. OAS944 TaxID=2664089 RepID=UPI003493E29A|nr:FkbM family methyltransferase [Chitinophagaceae bacterium OAS944]